MFQELLLLSPFLTCFFWAITLAVDWKKNWRVQNLWIIVLVVGMINSFYWMYMGRTDHHLFSKLTVLVAYTHAGFYALLFLFYRALTDRRPFTWKDYAVLAPPLLMGVLFTLCTIILGTGHFEDMMSGVKGREAVFAFAGFVHTVQYLIGAYLNNLLALVLVNVLCVFLIIRKIRTKTNPRQFFALPEGYSEAHANQMVWALFILLVFMFIFLVGEYLYYVEDYIPFYVLFAVQGGFFYYISYQVYRLRERGRRSSQRSQRS